MDLCFTVSVAEFANRIHIRTLPAARIILELGELSKNTTYSSSVLARFFPSEPKFPVTAFCVIAFMVWYPCFDSPIGGGGTACIDVVGGGTAWRDTFEGFRFGIVNPANPNPFPLPPPPELKLMFSR